MIIILFVANMALVNYLNTYLGCNIILIHLVQMK